MIDLGETENPHTLWRGRPRAGMKTSSGQRDVRRVSQEILKKLTPEKQRGA